jgi:Zn-dependent peptidase ImmA (M78 family)/transcriptional regulator with XRE-family HTH domain
MFNPQRLTFARKRRGMDKTRLAKQLDVQLRTVTAYEKGEFEPKAEVLRRLVDVLRFPEEFYFQRDIEELSPATASFRSMTKMSASKRDIALSSGAIALLINKAVESRFELPSLDLPDLSREPTPEAAAASLRRHWGLGEQPIKNMIHLLESKGIRVFSLAIAAKEVDAFSLWREDQPLVFLNTQKSSERSRFDSAHELGHLVLHRHGELEKIDGSQQFEREANAFASAFLMPQGSVFAYAPKLLSMGQLVERKKIWGVSVAALNYRFHQLGVTTEWHYRELCIQIASAGYRSEEPESLPRETSQILAKVFSTLRSENVHKIDIANELNIDVTDLDELIFGLVINGVASSNPIRIKKQRSKDHLVLIK